MEITWLQAVAGVILSTVALSYYFRKEAKTALERAEKIAVEKSSLIDQEVLKSYSLASMEIIRKMVEFLKKSGVRIEETSEAMGEAIIKLLEMPREELRRKIEDTEIPPELRHIVKINEEDKDHFISISFLAMVLKNVIPDMFSRVVNKITLAIIFGVLCGVLIPFIDLTLALGLNNASMVISVLACLLGCYYFYYGIYQIVPLTSIEAKLKKLEKAKNIGDLEEVISEMMEQYG